LIGVEPEIIQRPEADCISIGVLRKRFAVPGYGIRGLGDSPRRAAETLIVSCPVVCPARFLRWCVKVDVTDIDARTQRHTKGLNSAIQVLVIKSILVVPDPNRRIGHFVAHEPDTIVAWIRLDLIYHSARICPSHDGRLHLHRVTNVRKREVRRRTTYSLLTVRDVVIHVALVWMRLAPGVFTRGNVSGFGKVARAGVLRWVEIGNVHPDAVRYTIVGVAVVVVCGRREISRERVDPCARSDLALAAIQAGSVRVRAPRAEMRACNTTAGVAAKVAGVFFQCFKRMFPPRLANLFEAFVVK